MEDDLRSSSGRESPPWGPRTIRGARRRLPKPGAAPRRVCVGRLLRRRAGRHSSRSRSSLQLRRRSGRRRARRPSAALPAAPGVPEPDGGGWRQNSSAGARFFAVQSSRAWCLAASTTMMRSRIDKHSAIFLLVGMTRRIEQPTAARVLFLVPLLGRAPQSWSRRMAPAASSKAWQCSSVPPSPGCFPHVHRRQYRLAIKRCNSPPAQPPSSSLASHRGLRCRPGEQPRSRPHRRPAHARA